MSNFLIEWLSEDNATYQATVGAFRFEGRLFYRVDVNNIGLGKEQYLVIYREGGQWCQAEKSKAELPLFPYFLAELGEEIENHLK